MYSYNPNREFHSGNEFDFISEKSVGAKSISKLELATINILEVCFSTHAYTPSFGVHSWDRTKKRWWFVTSAAADAVKRTYVRVNLELVDVVGVVSSSALGCPVPENPLFQQFQRVVLFHNLKLRKKKKG